MLMACAERGADDRPVQPIGWVRRLSTSLPRGAVVLSVLSLAYFGMGLIRNRVFANTYGAGAELDAYNAAFRIPEIALDVLVAAGLTAPFVPIFTSLRRTDEGAANTFGQTILTGAIVIMAVASTLLAIAAPWLADAFEGFDPTTRALATTRCEQLHAQVPFVASFALGEVLVANRRFAFYALAPVLYTTGIVLARCLRGPLRVTTPGAPVGPWRISDPAPASARRHSGPGGQRLRPPRSANYPADYPRTSATRSSRSR
jgi:peptidoglycan biosynthesis protein MviN/MurJ (putative lipid II flippase)